MFPGASHEQQEKIKLHEQVKRNLEQEVYNLKSEANKQRKIFAGLEEERDRWGYISLIIFILVVSF
jgi:hypothetical protein